MASYVYLPPLPYYDTFQQVTPFQPSLQPFSATGIPTQSPPVANAGIQPIQHLLLTAGREIVAGTKRGSEEMLHQAQSVIASTNGLTVKTDSSPELEPNDAKKVRLDSAIDSNGNPTPTPSRVIHVNNIPIDTSEAELVQLAVPFGKVTNVMVARHQNQAFIEMAEVSQAITCVHYHQNVPAHIRGQSVFLQFSAVPELNIEQNHAASIAICSATAAQSYAGSDSLEPKTVLHIIVDNLIYPVTIDVLKQIFSRYGQVQKIIIFSKNNQFQALLQYSDPISAQTAKVSLDGQNIYNNCCTLRIDFSKLPTLNIKYNNEKSRDYTNPTLPPGDGIPTMSHQSTESPSPLGMSAGNIIPSMSFAPQLPPGFGAPLTYMTAPSAANPMTHGAATHTMHPMQFSAVQLPQGLSAMQAMSAAGLGLPPFPGYSAAPMMSMGLPHTAASQMAANMAAIRLPTSIPQTGCVILVSNLDEEKVTPDDLFTLFGVYGDVIRVKILFNKKDNALLQYSEPTQAQLALTHLDKIKVWDKQIRVAPSKHPIVQMPTDMQADGAKLTKDYTNSPLHRYKKKGSKNYQNIYPPSATLHLSNIPPDISAELLKAEFAKYGTVVAFKFFEKDHKMALMQMVSVDEAVTALMRMHNFQLGEASHLRVSFSKSTITPPNVVMAPQ